MITKANKVITDRVVRERTFDILGLREDGKDVLPQVIITIQQILSEKFTGQIILNCGHGGVNNILVREGKRV